MSAPAPPPRVHRTAVVAAAGLLLLLAAGASVNSLGAALSVPDWPLSYGRLLPLNFTGNATHEQSHRLLAALCILPMAALAVVVARHERRRWVRAAAFGAVALFFLQIALGGAVVLWLSPGWLTALHMVLAQLTFAGVAGVAVATSRGWVERTGPSAAGASHLVDLVALLVLLQIALGAAGRHPPAGEASYVAALVLHLVNALALVGLAVALVVSLARREAPRPLRGAAAVLLALLGAQLAIGVPLLVVAPEPLAGEWRAPRSFAYLHILHVLAAALSLGCAASLALRVRRQEP